MKANYNVIGNDRKALVAAIENLTGDKAVYMRMPPAPTRLATSRSTKKAV